MKEKFFLEEELNAAGGGAETVKPSIEGAQDQTDPDEGETLVERYSARKKAPKVAEEQAPVITEQYIAGMAESIKEIMKDDISLSDRSEIKKAFMDEFRGSAKPKLLGNVFNKAWRLLERQNYFLDKVEGSAVEPVQGETNEKDKDALAKEEQKPERVANIVESPKGVFEKDQKIQVEYDGQMVEWKILGFKDNGDPIIQGRAPGKRNGEIIFADWNDIKKWNPGFTIPEQKKQEVAPTKKFSPESRTSRAGKQNQREKNNRVETSLDVADDFGNPLKTSAEVASQRAENILKSEAKVKAAVEKGIDSSADVSTSSEANKNAQIERMTSIDEMRQKILPQLEQNVRNEIFSLKNMTGGQSNRLYHEMLDNPLLKDFILKEYVLVRDSISSQVPKLDFDSVMVPYRVVLDNLDSRINSDPNFDYDTAAAFNEIMRDYLEQTAPEIDKEATKSAESAEPAMKEPIEKLEQTPEPESQPTEDELAKFEAAMSTDGFEEFLANDPKNLDDRSVAETLKLFEVFRHKELVTNTISTIAGERFAAVTGFEYAEGKASVDEYINREAFENPDKILHYTEQVVKLVEQQNTIKNLEAKAEKYKETLPDHKLMTKPEFDRAFDEVAELSKYFGPARMKIKAQQEISTKWLNSDSFLKSKIGLLKSYLFDIPYAALHYSATLAGFHSKERDEARDEMKKTVGAENFTRKTENEYKAKVADMLRVSNTVREIEFKRNAIHEGYTSTKEVLAGAFLEAKEAIETAKKKIKEEVDKLLGKVSAISDIKGVQDLLNKNTDAKLYGEKTILTEADVKSIQNRIDLKARVAIDNHVEKALSGTEGKKDNTILGTLKKSMEAYMNSGVASMKSEQIRAQVREALDKVIMKTKKGGKQENKIIHNRAVAFAKINRF